MVQNAKNDRWSFPKGTYESGDMAYYFTAIREMEEETTFQLDKDYTVATGGCRYGNRMYFYGTTLDGFREPQINTVIPNEHKAVGWFSRTELPKPRNKDMEDWISDGMPNSCGNNDEL